MTDPDGFPCNTFHNDSSLSVNISSTNGTELLFDNSSTFGEHTTIFNNDTVFGETANASQMQASVSETSYNCQLYRFIMSVGITGSLCCFGILGNVLTLLVFSKFQQDSSDRKSRSSATLLLSGLAISDISLLVTFFIMKTIPSFLSFTGVFPEFFRIYAFLLVYGWPCVGVAQSINTWVTVLVALHRFVAIISPYKAVIYCTYEKARLHLIFVAFTVTIYELPTFFDNEVNSILDSDNKTFYVPAYGELNKNYYYHLIYKTTLYYIIMYLIPWILLAIITVFLTRAVKQAQQFRSQMGASHHDKTEDITASLIAVVVTSLVCRPWEPVRRLIEAILGSQPGCGHYYFYYEEFPSLTSALNSSANFILYYLFGKRFSKTLRAMFALGKSAKSAQRQSMGTSMSDLGSSVRNRE